METSVVLERAQQRGVSGRRRAWRMVRSRPLGLACLLVLATLSLAAALAPMVAPYGYDEADFLNRLKGPSTEHPFGTDNLGRDLLSRVLYGMRVSLFIAVGAVLLAESMALLIAVVTGYFGGWLDALVQRVIDIWLAVPVLVLLVSLVGVAGPGVITALLATGLLSVPASSRLLRSAVLGVRGEPYVEAARALGASHPRVLLVHIIPNITHLVVYSATIALGAVIMLVASLGFLGLGVPPPQPDLGGMLSGAGLQFMRRSPWLALWPGLAIMLIVFTVNIAGDTLRDLLDPRLRG